MTWKELHTFKKTMSQMHIKSKVWLEAGMLKVVYELSGDLDEVLLSKPLLNPARKMGLWESTCFEMFIKNAHDEQYLEFNVTSEYNWNVFNFPHKGARIKEFQGISNIGISGEITKDSFCLNYSIPLDKLPPKLWSTGNMKIGLSSVVETKEGDLSYWALSHPDKKPNFHHQESFTYDL